MVSTLTGTALVETFVQTVAYSHLIANRDRVGALLLAAPERGKTTIACAARAKHVKAIAVITGRSVLKELQNKDTEFLLFNDLAMVRSLSKPTVALLIGLLNQIAQGERGEASFAGQDTYTIDRTIGVIGCLPFKVFTDQRSRWHEMGFISRMIPFAYEYDADLIAHIKQTIDRDVPVSPRAATMPPIAHHAPVHVSCPTRIALEVRILADVRAVQLRQIGIRLLKHYHTLIRAHALRYKRRTVIAADLDFLRAVDAHVSITECKPL